MKSTEKLRLMQNLDEKYIEEADKTIRFTARKKLWMRGLSIAACAVLVCGIAAMPFLSRSKFSSEEILKETNREDSASWITSDGKEICIYENGEFDYVPFSFLAKQAMEDNEMLVLPEPGDVYIDNDVYALNALYYRPILTHDSAYSYVYRKVQLDHIDRKIGETTVKIGWNEEKKENIVCSAQMYAIRGIDPQYAIAVKPDASDRYVQYGDLNGYLLWYRGDVSFSDFSELVEAYNLKNQFYVGPAFLEGLMTGTGIVQNIIYPNEQNRIFGEKLLAINGTTVENTVIDTNAAYIDIECGFLVTGGSFGMKIYEDGYLVTNIGGTLHTFDIGKETAAELISFGRSIPDPYRGVNYSADKKGEESQTTLPYNPTQTSGAYIPEDTTVVVLET